MNERATTDRIEDLPDHFLKCRVYGHSWDQISVAASRLNPKIFSFGVALRCITCGTERYDGINHWGFVDLRTYNYPHGYPLSFSLTRSDARQEYIRRTSVSPEVKKMVREA